jgi:hypothetical protein
VLGAAQSIAHNGPVRVRFTPPQLRFAYLALRLESRVVPTCSLHRFVSLYCIGSSLSSRVSGNAADRRDSPHAVRDVNFPSSIISSSPINSTPPSNSSAQGSPTPLPGKTPADPHLITAHPDGNCEQPLAPGASDIFYNIKQYPGHSTNSSVAFPGAEAKSGGSFDVWFNMGKPELHCRNIIMVPFSQSRPTPGLPVGK